MATQKGRNWSSGDIVTAANLNSIERGVSAVAEEYTPTTWANGNTVTAAGLNNIEQGIANAGGGSGGFSICTMTVNGDLYGDYILVPNIIEDDSKFAVPLIATGGSIQVILCDGNAMMLDVNGLIASVTGNIQSLSYGRYIITGDCTITTNEPTT